MLPPSTTAWTDSVVAQFLGNETGTTMLVLYQTVPLFSQSFSTKNKEAGHKATLGLGLPQHEDRSITLTLQRSAPQSR